MANSDELILSELRPSSLSSRTGATLSPAPARHAMFYRAHLFWRSLPHS